MRRLIPSILKSRPVDVLAVEWDTLQSHAAVYRLDARGVVTLAGQATSAATDLKSAVADLSRQLRGQLGRLPSEAILLSSHVQSTVLRLPVNPRKPLPLRNMLELIHWEIEPYMAQHRARRIGAILVGRGHLRPADLERLLAQLGPAETDRERDLPSRRFGELAIEAGLVTPDQLNECLALQRASQDFAGPAACGWTPLEDGPSDNNNWRWLACGVPHSYRRHGVEVFRTQGLRLRALYPLVGCARASLNGQMRQRGILLECNSGFLNCTSFADGRVDSCRTLFTHEPGNPLQACLDMIDGHAERVWLAGRWPDLTGAARELQTRLGRPCTPVTLATGASPEAGPRETAAMIGLQGAATDFLSPRRTARVRVASVPDADPVSPLHQRRSVQVLAASAALTAALVAAAIHLHGGRMIAQEALAEHRALLAAQGEVAALEGSLKNLKAEIVFFRDTLPARQTLIPDLLSALEAGCPPEVTVRGLEETTKGEIVLAGWGLSPQHIQAFRIRLQDRLPTLTVTDGGRPIREEPARRGLAGYTFELRMTARKTGAATGGRP